MDYKQQEHLVELRKESMMNTWDLNEMFDLGKKYDKYMGLKQKVGYRDRKEQSILRSRI